MIQNGPDENCMGVVCFALYCEGFKITLPEDAVAQSNGSGAISNRNLLNENNKQRSWCQ